MAYSIGFSIRLIEPGIVGMPGFFLCKHSDQDRERDMFSIRVNGDSLFVEPGSTVAGLLERLKKNPKFLAVELNRKVIPRAEHSRTTLSADDQIEIVTLVGGG